MDERVDKIRAASFDKVSGLYDRARAGYSRELIDDLVKYAHIDRQMRCLEIGPGSGKATLHVAAIGCSIDCIEPGANFAGLLEKTYASNPTIRIFNSKFEEFPLESHSYDLVYAATSIHWIDPTIRFTKPHVALRTGGTIAVFAHLFPDPQTEQWREIFAAHDRVAGGMREAAYLLVAPEDAYIPVAEELKGHALFGELVIRRYPQVMTLSTADYVALLGTQSNFLLLPDEQQSALVDEIIQICDGPSYGGVVTRPYVSVLYMARSKPT